jgi:outer membrane protein TolC
MKRDTVLSAPRPCPTLVAVDRRRTRYLAALLGVASVTMPACQHVPPRPLSAERTAAALDARSLDDPRLARFLAAALGQPPPEWPLHTWDLTRLTLAALYFQPSLEVVRAHAALAGAAVETAGALPNPTLSFTPEYSVNPMGAVSPWVTTVHLDWMIETAGKRGWRIDRATADSEAARASITTEAWRVRRDLATALVTLAAARRQAAALADEVALDARLVDLVEARLRAGAASAPDAAPMRFALLQAITEHAAAAAQIEQAETKVAAAIGVPARALAGVDLPAGPDDADTRTLLDLAPDLARRRALLERADVHQAVASYAAAEAALGLELARQYPDIHLGPGYQFDQGQNKWSVGLSVDLPLLNHNEGPIAEAVAARDEAAARLIATQATVLAEIEHALARRAGERTRGERLRAVVADRDANLARARSALTAGALDRASVVAAEVERSQAARAAIDADAALTQALVDLEAAVAGPMTARPRRSRRAHHDRRSRRSNEALARRPAPRRDGGARRRMSIPRRYGDGEHGGDPAGQRRRASRDARARRRCARRRPYGDGDGGRWCRGGRGVRARPRSPALRRDAARARGGPRRRGRRTRRERACHAPEP